MAGRRSAIFGVGAAPAASPPHFGMVLGAVGAAQTPKIDDLQMAQKPCIDSPSVEFVPNSPLKAGPRGRNRAPGPSETLDLRGARRMILSRSGRPRLGTTSATVILLAIAPSFEI